MMSIVLEKIKANCPVFDHGEYWRFQLEHVSVEECFRAVLASLDYMSLI